MKINKLIYASRTNIHLGHQVIKDKSLITDFKS